MRGDSNTGGSGSSLSKGPPGSSQMGRMQFFPKHALSAKALAEAQAGLVKQGQPFSF